jgi:hypothetical protein
MDISVEILPKIYLAAIPKYWKFGIPTDIPESSSTFSLSYDTDEEFDAVKEMEANLNTEESIVTPEDIPENEILSSYLGTYNVIGTPGELTLLSPNSVGNKDINVVAYHYIPAANEEDETPGVWEKIEDAQIIDGYVYGTLVSFSPIAVFTTRRDTYIDDSKYCTSNKALICNGIPVYIHLDDEGTPIAEDGYGKVIDLTGVLEVIGGSIDGSDLDSTSITIDGVDTIYGIRAGSFSDNLDNVAHVKKAVVNVKNVKNSRLGITGGYYGSITDEYTLNIENSTYSWSGAGESIWQQAPSGVQKDSGTSDPLSKGRTKKYILNAKNCKANLVFIACNCGLTYTDANEGHVEGCTFDYLISGGSNGGTGTSNLEVKDSTIDIYQTNNRGYITLADKVTFKDCKVNHLFIAGDSTDSTVTGVTKHFNKLEVLGKSDVVFYVGTQNGKLIASHDELAALIDKIAVSRDTTYTFGDENGASLFGDSIAIK